MSLPSLSEQLVEVEEPPEITRWRNSMKRFAEKRHLLSETGKTPFEIKLKDLLEKASDPSSDAIES
jgi:hypothetical protein